VQTYKSGIRVTDLATLYSMLKSTISTILQRKHLKRKLVLLKVLLKLVNYDQQC
jgi:hypothetical protein